MVDQALRTIFVWLTALLALFAGIFGLIETFLRRLLSQAGLSANVQSVVIIVVASCSSWPCCAPLAACSACC